MATIHVPTTETLLRALSMLAAARGTTIREEVNEACRAHVRRQSHLVVSAAKEMTPEPLIADGRAASNSDSGAAE